MTIKGITEKLKFTPSQIIVLSCNAIVAISAILTFYFNDRSSLGKAIADVSKSSAVSIERVEGEIGLLRSQQIITDNNLKTGNLAPAPETREFMAHSKAQNEFFKFKIDSHEERVKGLEILPLTIQQIKNSLERNGEKIDSLTASIQEINNSIKAIFKGNKDSVLNKSDPLPANN